MKKSVVEKRFDFRRAYMITQMSKVKSDNMKLRCAALATPH